ncbi:MAG: hypothetical protein LLG01_11265 [Planctomycetaceae bacterium]|nr:hypothetical protein [Planctomycetaceae bacterium]
MLAWTKTQQIVVILVVWFGFNLISAFRVLVQFRRQGRRGSGTVWFIVTLLFSAIPYLIVGMYYRARWIIEGDEDDGAACAPRRCPHCQALILDEGKSKTCSRCGMALREDDVA